jgi:hypothetical protein
MQMTKLPSSIPAIIYWSSGENAIERIAPWGERLRAVGDRPPLELLREDGVEVDEVRAAEGFAEPPAEGGGGEEVDEEESRSCGLQSLLTCLASAPLHTISF